MHASEDDIINTAKTSCIIPKPKSVKFIDELPKAPTGKILKREFKRSLLGRFR